MRVEQVAIKWAIYIKKKRDKIEKTFLSRNQNLIAISSIGIIACVVSCGLIAIGLIVGGITKYVRSKKQKESDRNSISSGNHAVQQDIEQSIDQCKVIKDLTKQNVNLYKSIQNTQEVMNNLNSLNNNMKIGI